jgi:hypothetical protein
LSVQRPAELPEGVEPLEVFVELLAELDTDTSSTDFYDRICEAICRLTTMERAAIFMADIPRRRAVVVGAHGTSFRDLTLPESMTATPFVQRAPTTTARRRGMSAMKIAARSIVVRRQIASQMRS